MKVVVFGANGRVGKLVVSELLAKNHEVVAFVHTHFDLQPQPHLEIVKGDAGDLTAVAAVLQNADAVISALSSWGTPSKNILTSGMSAIIPAMQISNSGRLISLTGAEAEAANDRKTIIHRLSKLALTLVASKILKDGETHIRLLEQSRLEWTVIRSPVMNDHGSPSYQLNDKRPPPWVTINRTAVARSLVDVLENHQYIRQAPYIHRD